MEDFKQRLLDETRFEVDKLHKLQMFMAGDIFPTLTRIEKDLLYDQVVAMNRFVQILGKRLENYGIKFTNKGEK
jgi:hypothetical protein